MAALNLADRKRIFGEFTWEEMPQGRIKIDRFWRAKHIVWLDFPYPLPMQNGKMATGCWVHKKVKLSLLKALEELKAAGLEGLIKSWDGCYVPRHLGWTRKRGLSPHCWGIAVDVNVATQGLNTDNEQDDRLIEIMGRHGFGYGGGNGPNATAIGKAHKLWNTQRDPMHFEFCWKGV